MEFVSLPSEYRQVEWLESNGNQYIDLPFGFNPTDVIEVEGNLFETATDKYLVTSKYWDTTKRFAIFGIYTSQAFTVGFGSASTRYTYVIPYTNNDKERYLWTYKDKVFSVYDHNNVLVGISDRTSTGFGDGDTTGIRLFFGYNGNSKGRICYYHHKKADGTEVNLIPCYRILDDKPGMYDLVTGTFFTNSGTGEFLMPPRLSMMAIRRRILANTPHVESVSGSGAVQFSTDMSVGLKDCKIYFTPIQEGSGTASPVNERPISGFDGITITLGSTTYTIPFPRTIYGGYLDLVRGEVVETHEEYADSGSGTWSKNSGTSHQASNSFRFEHSVGVAHASNSNSANNPISDAYCNYLKPYQTGGMYYSEPESYGMYQQRLYVRISDISEVADLKAYFEENPLEVVYPLATPTHIPLTDPPTIKTLKGINNLITNANGNVNVSFWTH